MKCLGNLTDCSLYVDDFCICYRSKSMATIERQLQQNLNKIESWAASNGFKFSKSKTQCVQFCQLRKQHDDPVLHLYGSPIPVVEESKFLGILFDRKLSFIPHIKYLKAKCLKALNLLKVLSHTSWGADRTTLLKLYRSLVRSKLDYGCIIYGSARKSYLQMLDPIHNQGLRLALGAFRTSPVASLYVEADEPSLYSRREKLSLQYAIRQIVGIPMGTNCAPLVADLFLFCYERDFMLSLSDNNQADIIEAFNSTSRYLDDLLNIDNPYFEQMVGQIYPTELQLNKANSSDTVAPFLDLNLSITNGIVSSKIYDKRDDFNFEIVNFPFFDGDVPRSPSYGVYISQLIRFARVCSNVDDFNNRNLFLTAKLLKQGYRYHKIRKAFSKFYYRHSELIVKYNIGLKTLLQQGISEPIFYGDLVYKFKRIVGKPNFSDQFKKIVKRYIRVGYNLDIMRQSACLVLNPITVYSYGFLFNCTTVGQASDSMTALT